jgi:medium-chain acyl-[acyl-carrier-protein] hydrolase
MLIVSAVDAPNLLPIPPRLHDLPDADFLNAIRDFGGTPEAILQHQELVAMMLPIMRADIKLLETYQYEAEAPLDIPLYALGGLTDTVVARQNLLDWEQQGGGPWQSQFFPGNHFYIRQSPNTQFFNYLARILGRP